MFTKRVDLYEYFGIKKEKHAMGFLNIYCAVQSEEYCVGRKRPAMIVVPGGGYTMRSDRENEPIAIKYLAEGFNAFTLEYSCNDVFYPACFLEGCMAVAYVRENADKLFIDANHIAMIGFSAGAHLTAMVGNIFDDKVIVDTLGEHAKNCRPDAVILSYPVITSGQYGHHYSFEHLTNNNQEVIEKLSMENNVSEKSCPAFIWCTVNDQVVPSENSMLMAMAYRKAKVPFELHMFEDGVHGLALANMETFMGDVFVNKPAQKWVKLSINWLKKHGFEIIV